MKSMKVFECAKNIFQDLFLWSFVFGSPVAFKSTLCRSTHQNGHHFGYSAVWEKPCASVKIQRIPVRRRSPARPRIYQHSEKIFISSPPTNFPVVIPSHHNPIKLQTWLAGFSPRSEWGFLGKSVIINGPFSSLSHVWWHKNSGCHHTTGEFASRLNALKPRMGTRSQPVQKSSSFRRQIEGMECTTRQKTLTTGWSAW